MIPVPPEYRYGSTCERWDRQLKRTYEKYVQGHYNITFQEYLKLVKKLSELMFETLYNGQIVTLPHHLGELEVTTKPVQFDHRRKVDYGETNKLRKQIHPDWTIEQWREQPYEKRCIVYHQNTHTDRKLYQIQWRRSNRLAEAEYYLYVPSGKILQGLAKVLKDEEQFVNFAEI